MITLSILNRNLKLLGFCMATRQFVMAGMMIIRTLYLYEIGFDPFTIGLLSTVATIFGAVRSGIVGLLADKYGKRLFLILGGLFSFLRFAIYAFYTDFLFLVFAQGIGAFGEGAGAGQPAVTGAIADNSTTMNRTQLFSLFAITNAVAATAGSLLAGLPTGVQDWFGFDKVSSYQLYFALGAVFSLISTIIIIPMTEKKSEARTILGGKGLLPRKSLGIITKFSFVRSVGGFGNGLIQPLIPLWFKLIFGIGEEVLSIVYAASRFLSIFSYLAVPRFVSAIGEMESIAISRIASSVTMVATVLSPNYVFSAMFLVAYRISLMFTMPIRQSFISSIVDPSERSAAVGISNFSRMGFRSFAPAIGGYLMQSVSMSLPFLIGPATIAINGALYYLLFNKIQPKG